MLLVVVSFAWCCLAWIPQFDTMVIKERNAAAGMFQSAANSAIVLV
jgi:hypothetical protein